MPGNPSSTKTAPAPTPQEVTRKLSITHKPPKKPQLAPQTSGTESDSDSYISPDHGINTSASIHTPGPASVHHAPLSSIAEAQTPDGEETDDDDEEEPDASELLNRRTTEEERKGEGVIKAGYLWKKGERRKTWKKRWFVLRPAHLAYYKDSAEYKLLRLLDLSEVHSVTPCSLKRHDNTFGVVSPARTYYLQAENPREVQEWVAALNDVREALMSRTSLIPRDTGTPPITIPHVKSPENVHSNLTASSPTTRGYAVTSSDEDDVSRSYGSMPTMPGGSSVTANLGSSPAKLGRVVSKDRDPSKVVLNGYLLKCGSKRKNWRKRWFVLTGEKLLYAGSHMDTKPHREIKLSDILDAFEYTMDPRPGHSYAHGHAGQGGPNPPLGAGSGEEGGDGFSQQHTFKIVATKRTFLLSAPSEEEEIKWLSAVRALLARRTQAGPKNEPGPGRPSVGVDSGGKRVR
ncbi:PH-domain-containing protein [Sistotremastrum niveocremeum HHB9708]|uniref:PH-domain-containing protein n=1 Tax=Sistotremastrum niveocremeum HHB9708 TaxID=1314777 RepID=A0A164VH42_9AGAM|nr:PH-domain-containing protein [Sistotremastrum niveocremeum HHB9708]